MKNKNYMRAGIFLITLVACQQQEATYFETETIVRIDLLVATAGDELEKSGTDLLDLDYVFSGEGNYQGVSVTKVNNKLYRIQEVKPHNSPLLSIAGISEEGSINSLQLEWGIQSPADAGYDMQAPIDLLLFNYRIEDGNFMVELDDALIQLVKSLNNNHDSSIKIIISGSSALNLHNSAHLEIPVIVESSTLGPRFELF